MNHHYWPCSITISCIVLYIPESISYRFPISWPWKQWVFHSFPMFSHGKWRFSTDLTRPAGATAPAPSCPRPCAALGDLRGTSSAEGHGHATWRTPGRTLEVELVKWWLNHLGKTQENHRENGGFMGLDGILWGITTITTGWWWLEHDFLFSHILGMSSYQLTSSYFSEGLKPPSHGW